MEGPKYKSLPIMDEPYYPERRYLCQQFTFTPPVPISDTIYERLKKLEEFNDKCNERMTIVLQAVDILERNLQGLYNIVEANTWLGNPNQRKNATTNS